MRTVLRSPHVAIKFLFLGPSWFESCLWAIIFLLIGIAIGRSCRWIRPILLGTMPAYIMLNIGQAVVDIRLSQGFLSFSQGLPANLAHITTLSLAGLIFVWFCTPQIDGAFAVAGARPSRLAELPVPLSSWAMGCIVFGLLSFIQMLFYIVRDIALRPMLLRYTALSLIIALGGALTLCRKRYALIAASLCLLVLFVQGAMSVFAQVIAVRHPMGRGQPDLFIALTLPGVNALFSLAAALFGFYAARFLKEPLANVQSM